MMERQVQAHFCSREVWSLLLASLIAGCGGDDGKAPPLAFVTFNTALIAHADHVEARALQIAQDLPALKADVVCLQEVWLPKHVDAIVAATRKHFPYAHASVEATSESASCDAAEADTLIGCIDQQCADVEPSAMAICAVAHCANQYASVSPACQQCVLANQTKPPQAIVESCQSSEGESVAYRNQNGLLLLSKLPLHNRDYLAMESSLGDRGALFASIDSQILPSVNLLCTHLAATLGEVTYTGKYGTWAGERAEQIESLAEFLEAKQDPGETAVVLGDMNCGPADQDVVAEDGDGFELLLDAGLVAPYLESGHAQCTYCSSNSVMQYDGPDVMIDHVLFSQLPPRLELSTTRIFDEQTRLVDGETSIETFRSDHYGLKVTVSEPTGD